MNNFSTFYTQAIRDKQKIVKRGKYKGQRRSIKSKDLPVPGLAYHNPMSSQAPSASTYTIRG